MQSILEELFYGNIDPNAGTFTKNSEYGKALKTISDNEEKLMALLEGKEKNLFLDFTNAQSTLNGETAVGKFKYGFTLGALLMMEVLTNHEELLRDER